MLTLVTPSMSYEKQIHAYHRALKENRDSLDGTSFLDCASSVSDWLASLQLFRSPETLPAGYALAETWLVVREADDCLVGMTNLRLALTNPYLQNFGGHIGYSVHPAERSKGYGKIILHQTLIEAGKRGLSQVLLTCDDDNVASAKIIEANHGKLENKQVDPTDNQVVRRYWITIADAK